VHAGDADPGDARRAGEGEALIEGRDLALTALGFGVIEDADSSALNLLLADMNRGAGRQTDLIRPAGSGLAHDQSPMLADRWIGTTVAERDGQGTQPS